MLGIGPPGKSGLPTMTLVGVNDNSAIAGQTGSSVQVLGT